LATSDASVEIIPDPQFQKNKPLRHLQSVNRSIPIKRISSAPPVQYVSAIALKLATPGHLSALDLAQQIAADFAQTNDTNCRNGVVTEQIWHSFTVQVTPPGWIYFRLTEEGLSEWLQLQINQTLEIEKADPDRFTDFSCTNSISDVQAQSILIRDSTNIFLVLHTHARCCAILRLGSQLQLVQFNRVNAPERGELWNITQPDPLPWLLPDRTLRCQHPAEWNLIDRLCTVIDDLSEWNLPHMPEQYLKWAVHLSQDWQKFHAHCRISSNDPALAQVRLGLTMATQFLLKSLIEALDLATVAPSEL
jgi:arginyl-tRNA synthetase